MADVGGERPTAEVDTNPAPPEGPGLGEALDADGAVGRVKALLSWWNQTRAARMLARYNTRYGGLMSSGMALTTMLSLTAVLTVAITVFMAVLGGNVTLRNSFIDALNTALPGIIKTGSNSSGLLDPNSLVQSNASSITGIVALVVAAWSAVTLVGNLVKAVQSMFGIVALPENGAVKIGRNALGALALGAGLLVSSGLGIAVGTFGRVVMRWLHIDAGLGRFVLGLVGYLLPLVVDAAVAWMIIRFSAGVRVPRRDLIWGLAIFAVAAGVLRTLGTSAVGAVDDPLLAAAAGIVTLILWINLEVRVLLTVCAWMANPPQAVPVDDPEAVHFKQTPNFVTMSVPATLDWPHNAVTGEVQPIVTVQPEESEGQDPLPGTGDEDGDDGKPDRA